MGRAELLLQDSARAGTDSIDFLKTAEIFGAVGTDSRLGANVAGWIEALRHKGVAGALRAAIDTGRL